MCVTVMIFLLSLFGFAQQSYSSDGESEVQLTEAGQSNPSSVSSIEESIPINLGKTESQSSSVRQGAGIGIFVRMVVVLALVVGLIYLFFYFAKRNMGLPFAGSDTFLRRVATLPVGQNKSVQIVTLVDKAYMLGISDNAVNLLAEITDKELIHAMNLYADKHDNANRPKNFAEVLDLFMPGGPRSANTQKNVFETDSSDALLQSLRNQRLGGGGEQ